MQTGTSCPSPSHALRLSGGAPTSVTKLGQPLKVILDDYVAVSKDLASTARQRPLRTLLYLATGGILVTTWKKRPDLDGYINDILEYSNEIGQCSEAIRNSRAQSYIGRIIRLNSDGYLRYINLGLVAIVMERSSAPACKNYHETCKHLQPGMLSAWHRVIDVGLWGHWLQLERNMVDFDVSEDEFRKL